MARILDDEPVLEKRVHCVYCGKMVAYVKNDVQRLEGTDYGGGPSSMDYLVCPGPDCGNKIVLRPW